jgi:hypothetical protein
MNGRARLDEKENLRRLFNRGEAGEWLFDPIIEYTEVFATQAFDKVAARIGHDHSDVDAIDADVNRLLRLLRTFLGLRERAHAEHGGKEQCRQKTK